MARHPTELGARLEALLDERDHLRVKLSSAKDEPSTDAATIKATERRLWELEKEIARSWG